MNPLGTRARSEEFSRLLDGAISGPAALSAVGPMASYALVAGRLRTAGASLAPVSAPRAQFRAALRTRLVAVATVQANIAATTATTATPAAGGNAKPRALEAAVSWSQSRRAQRGMGVAAGAMASVVAVAGIAVAGSQSLPGDPFYGVKKGTEALELRTAGSDVDKGSKHLEFAAERLSEVRGLTLGRDAALGPAAPGTPSAGDAFGSSVTERVRETLAAMDAETRKGSDLLTAAYRDTHNDAPLEILSSFAGRQTQDLRDLLPDLPSAARPRAEDSLALISGVAVQTSQLLAVGVCTGDCAPTATAPQLPPVTGGPVPQPGPTTNTPCGCTPVPEPAQTSAPSPRRTADPEPSAPTPQSSEPSPSPRPSPTSPAPLPVPVPTLPVPVPTPPVPVPTITPTPLLPGISVPVVPAAPTAVAAGSPPLGG